MNENGEGKVIGRRPIKGTSCDRGIDIPAEMTAFSNSYLRTSFNEMSQDESGEVIRRFGVRRKDSYRTCRIIFY